MFNWTSRAASLVVRLVVKKMKKPAGLVYGAEEKPPLSIIIVSAVQHVAVIAIFMVYPLIIARQAGAPPAEIAAILRVGVLALALAVLLQALPRGPVGSHFLAPSIFTGVYLGPSLLAAKLGGLPLVWGMTIFAGFVEIGLSRGLVAVARLHSAGSPRSVGRNEPPAHAKLQLPPLHRHIMPLRGPALKKPPPSEYGAVVGENRISDH